MKRILCLISFCFFCALFPHAQFTRYLVKFRDKGNNPYSLSNPSAYLSQRAIERRNRYAIAIDSLDLPVSPGYINQLATVPNVTILNRSRWLNEVSIQATDVNAITIISGLSFVREVSGIAARTGGGSEKRLEESVTTRRSATTARTQQAAGDFYDYGSGSSDEMHLHHGEFLHNIGLRGEGMQTALLDAGFYQYNVFDVFDSMNTHGQVISTWDFVTRDTSVAEDNSHGMSCLSTIAANLPGQFVGTAPKTSFYLFRTEDAGSEYPIEELNWVCGAEKADSAGADVLSSSLGYTSFDNAGLNHSYADMNGHTTLAAVGAAIAARKGLLLFIAAGNEGANAWHYIMTPADADSVIAVGAVDINGAKGSFSSFGPTSDGRVKPDVAAVGVGAIIETSYNLPGTSQGTSFACPKMAGLGTCLWQGFPEFNNAEIISAIRQSGNAFHQPTDGLGYGIPDLRAAFTSLLTAFAKASVTITGCTATLSWSSKDVGAMKYEVERQVSGETGFSKIKELKPAPGSVLGHHSYQLTDTLASAPSGIVSYRVRQLVDTTENDIAAAYIDTASILVGTGCNIEIPAVVNNRIVVYPNPIQDELKLTVETVAAIPVLIIAIYDMHGKLLLRLQESKASGKASFTMNTGNFASGKYNIVVYDTQKKIGSAGFIKL